MYLKREMWNFELRAQINKMQSGKRAAVAAKAPKELEVSSSRWGTWATGSASCRGGWTGERT